MLHHSSRQIAKIFLGLACLAGGVGCLRAQTIADPVLDTPGRFFGVFSNDRTVPDRGRPVKSLSSREKWLLGTAQTFDPLTLLTLEGVAGLSQANNQYPSWGQGVKGFGRRYAAEFADHAASDYLTGSVFPVLLHQDPRYFRSAHGPAVRRLVYAIGRIAITRSDAGKNQVNFSEFLGNAGAAGLSNFYHPAGYRTGRETAQNFGLFLASDALGNGLKEFWPDLRHKLFRRLDRART